MFDDFFKIYDLFKNRGVDDPLFETLRLIDLLSKGAIRKTKLPSTGDEKLDLEHIAKKRKEGMPLEYIIGTATFMGYAFHCTPAALIPMEETELLVNVAVDLVKKMQEHQSDLTIVDMGTGCGSIAVSLAMNMDNIKVLASDISSEAVEIAKKNVDKFNLQDRVSLYCGDLFVPIQNNGYKGNVDMVVCNPPYIPTGSLANLSREITDYEPMVALDAGPYGINIYRRLISDSLETLKFNGILVFEIGERQEQLVTKLFEKNGCYRDIEYFKRDDKIRVIAAVRDK